MTVSSSTFAIHSLADAPDRGRPALERLKQNVGMVPNLAGAMAGSPTLIEAFVTLREINMAGSFAPLEREVLALANAVTNGCGYCQAIHATFALAAGLDAASVQAIRAGGTPADARLAALTAFTRAVLRERGRVSAADLDTFRGAGFSQAQALEVIVSAAVSTLANFAGRMTAAPPDEAIRAQYRTE